MPRRRSSIRAAIKVSCLVHVTAAFISPSALTVQRAIVSYQRNQQSCITATIDKREADVIIDDDAGKDFANMTWSTQGLHNQRNGISVRSLETQNGQHVGTRVLNNGHTVNQQEIHNGQSVGPLELHNGHSVVPSLLPTQILTKSDHGNEQLADSLSFVEEAIADVVTATSPSSNLEIAVQEQLNKISNLQKPWKRRHARSIQEGIRRETTTQLSSLLTNKRTQVRTSKRHYVARTITGLLNALAEESDGLEVEVQTRPETPFWRKQVDSIQIRFSRLGIQPIRMGGLMDDILQEATPELATVSCADEAFRRMDADDSGALDGEEIAQALNLAASTETDPVLMQGLASQLVNLYDLNGDGVIDREEYQNMVEDMANVRRLQQDKQSQLQQESQPSLNQKIKNLIQFPSKILAALIKSKKQNETLNVSINGDGIIAEQNSTCLMETIPKGSGTITFSDMKLDLRQLAFGAIPILKRITPSGPLILEPFTATLIGSFNKDDVMSSSLLDAGLRRLVARALRRRVRSFRDLVDMAVFYGRDWNMASQRAPQVEVAKLTSVEFDDQDRMVITGRVRIRTSPDAPTIENAFKVRTKIGTRKDGQVIRLVEPELALVAECPKGWERNIVSLCKRFNLPVPVRPEPLYAFFPIYSPFKVEDNDGFDMGEDNCLKSIYIKDGALRFEMRSVLRPGRFLGNHYIAFSFPTRTFIITLDRVRAGIRAARKKKSAMIAAQATAKRQKGDLYQDSMSQSMSKHTQLLSEDLAFFEPIKLQQPKRKPSLNPKRNKSFFSRFVEGYLGVSKEDEVRNERLTMAISDWFGRQGLNTTVK